MTAKLNAWLVACLLAATAGLTAFADPAPAGGLSVAYAVTNLSWANFQTPDGKAECPQGFNEGNREQFKALYPESGPPRALQATQLQYEIESWYPTLADDGFH